MIEFEKVSKVYPDGTTAVDEVSFTVPAHTTVVLLGSSGSGKSTLLGMVNRMVTPSSGRVLINDEDIAGRDPVQLRRSIGYVLQAGGLLPHRSVVDNIATVPVLQGQSRRDARIRATELLETVGLDLSLARRYPAQLSGGQQQRVGVARALAADPDILLMDEPFGAVDPIVRLELQREVRRLQQELGKTVLFVTHDIDEAFSLADEIVVLRPGGQIAQRDTPEHLLAHPVDDFVAEFIGLKSGAKRLHVVEDAGSRLVMDASGRLLGVIEG
ncbi:Carnitine transport ATP-binding protein OpuCA [Corynebacterium occultum]|uniref:ABC-type quaternary amine transporter n=1 Tax=Corynebacterium occultum TaxID=2675219 RepID=A0A6B8WPE1_9CORY|nr:ATP-binding cassette domain-containing protein [Corynebacterium occultum]QGU08218.1 Carnitine transport ATP-binding protein OpuCA [Corynebacterium occultum]